MSQTDEISKQKSMCLSLCACMCVCACVAFEPHGSRSIVQWTPPQWRYCACMTECMCVREPQWGSVWARCGESVCWFDWFSQSHLKLWMTWSPVAISSLQPQSPLFSPTVQSTMQFISLSPSPLFHAHLQQPLTYKCGHSFFPSFPSSSRTHIPSLSHTHSLKCQKQAPNTYICSTSSSSPLISQ